MKALCVFCAASPASTVQCWGLQGVNSHACAVLHYCRLQRCSWTGAGSIVCAALVHVHMLLLLREQISTVLFAWFLEVCELRNENHDRQFN
jgi:hypothetical protein